MDLHTKLITEYYTLWAYHSKEELIMMYITVYDTEAEELEKLAEDNDTTIAEIVEMLMEYKDDMKAGFNLK